MRHHTHAILMVIALIVYALVPAGAAGPRYGTQKLPRIATPDSIHGEIAHEPQSGPAYRYLLLEFDAPFETDAAVVGHLTKTSSYEVREELPTSGEAGTSALNGRPLTVVSAEAPGAGVIRLRIEGTQTGTGTLRLKAMSSDDADQTGFWVITQTSAKARSDFDGKLGLTDTTPVGTFTYAHSGPIRLSSDSKLASRTTFRLEGSVPFSRPPDVSGAASNDDASGRIADYLQLSVGTWQYRRSDLRKLDLVARSSGRMNGYEVVARAQWMALPSAGSHIFGMEAEVGARDGRSEWVNLTTKAPNRGNLVARLGAVAEWAPTIVLDAKSGRGINVDRAEGLRFFVRARGWVDYARNLPQGNLRLRGFADAELFYNFTKDYRVFARYELGYLPPDLTRRVGGFFAGMGAAF